MEPGRARGRLKGLGEHDAKGLGFSDELLAGLFGTTEEKEEEEGEPEEPEKIWVKEGELFELGKHRLYVGDSLTAEARAILFGLVKHVDAGDHRSAVCDLRLELGIGRDIADDKMVRRSSRSSSRDRRKAQVDRHPLHVHRLAIVAMLWNALKRHEVLVPKNGPVWDKGGSGLGTNYSMTYELILFVHKLEAEKATTQGARGSARCTGRTCSATTDRAGRIAWYNAAKPVGLLEELIGNSTDAGQLVGSVLGFRVDADRVRTNRPARLHGRSRREERADHDRALATRDRSEGRSSRPR